MGIKKLLGAFVLLTGMALGQAVRYDTSVSQLTYNNLLTPPSNATVAVYQYPGASTACTGGGCSAATTYTSDTAGTSCAASVPLTGTTSTSCTGALGNSGNLGFWALPGLYQYCVTSTNGFSGCWNVLLGPNQNATTTWAASQIFSAGIKTLNVTPITAGGGTSGSNALPWSSVYIGNAATNNGQLTGTFTGARVITFPDATDTVAELAATQTFTNKTLTAPTETNSALTTPTISGLTNGTGLQVFTTSTTCSTTGSAGNICTTASISLPVGYSDTNYRLFCEGVGPTQTPVISYMTKSNTSFTISVMTVTANVSTYTSFDCLAAHN